MPLMSRAAFNEAAACHLIQWLSVITHVCFFVFFSVFDPFIWAGVVISSAQRHHRDPRRSASAATWSSG